MKQITFFVMMLLASYGLNAQNTLLGSNAGYSLTSGNDNTFLGGYAGYATQTGKENTYVGIGAGFLNRFGSNNVCIGAYAGFNNMGSNKLFIANSAFDTPLIYGDFADDKLTVNGSLGVGEAVPAIPNADIKLYVNGRFSQEFSGNIGGIGNNDLWSSLGRSFAPNANVPEVYGMLNQWGDNSFIAGIKDGEHATVSWAGPNSRLDFDYLDGNFNSQLTAAIIPNGFYRFFVNGNVAAAGIWVDSDRRYKKDVKTITNALDKIEAIDGVTYQYKKETINGRNLEQFKAGNTLGFIAQDLEKILPELVNKDENGYYAVNYDGMIPVLVEGIKEQQQVISNQQEEITTQQEIITNLQARMDRLEALLNNQSNVTPSQGSIDTKIENAAYSGIVLQQNAPNPFNNITKIEYELPKELATASLVIYDMNGRSLAEYSVSGKGMVEFDATGLSNGTYIYAMTNQGKSIATRKMIIQK